MKLTTLITKSILSRKTMSILLILSIALSTSLILSLGNIKDGAKSSLSRSVSDLDLIIGAKTSDISLLLHSVFKIGKPSDTLTWKTYQRIRAKQDVKWAVPISLGDSHLSYPVLATTPSYFNHIKYGKKESLSFQSGAPFKTVFGIVIGHDISKAQAYKVGDYLFLSHHDNSTEVHDTHAFKITGILNQTGTAIDQTIIASLSGVKAIHLDRHEKNKHSEHNEHEHHEEKDHFTPDQLKPESVSAIFVGLNTKNKLFSFREELKADQESPLSVIIPALVIAELWSKLKFLDSALFGISLLVLGISFLGLLIAFLLSMVERQKELMILRAIGANSQQLHLLLCSEMSLLTSIGVILGLLISKVLSIIVSPIFEKAYGLVLSFSWISINDIIVSLSIIFFGFLMSFIPTYKAYKLSVIQGIRKS